MTERPRYNPTSPWPAPFRPDPAGTATEYLLDLRMAGTHPGSMIGAVDEIVSYWEAEGTPPFLFMQWLRAVEWGLEGAMDACKERSVAVEAEALRPLIQKQVVATIASRDAIERKLETMPGQPR